MESPRRPLVDSNATVNSSPSKWLNFDSPSPKPAPRRRSARIRQNSKSTKPNEKVKRKRKSSQTSVQLEECGDTSAQEVPEALEDNRVSSFFVENLEYRPLETVDYDGYFNKEYLQWVTREEALKYYETMKTMIQSRYDGGNDEESEEIPADDILGQLETTSQWFNHTVAYD